jgi:opacity protein-like surface antigen
MIKKLLLGFLFFISVYTFAQQDKKWSVEANYSIIPADGLGGADDIFELGIKYRFTDFNFFNLGLSLNGGFSNEKFDIPNVEGKLNTYYLQPRIFSEISIPGINRLRPNISLGYSLVNEDSSVISMGDDFSGNSTNGGFNINLGLMYDISDQFFIQAQYDFINLNIKDEIDFEGETIQRDFTEKLNNIKLGIGFRF